VSRSNRDPFDELAENTVGCVFSLLWGASASLVILISRAFQRKPEDRLRQLGSSGQWGAAPETIQCPACGAANDSDAHFCYFCGSQLLATVQKRRRE
jgi:hypothetical protein